MNYPYGKIGLSRYFTKKLGLKPRRSRAALIDYMYFMVDIVS